MDLAFGFPQIASICYGPGIHSPGSMNEVLINKKQYISLSDDLKEIIRIAANNANTQSYGEYINRNAISFQKMIKEHNVEFKILPSEIIKEFLKVSREVVLDNGKKDPTAMKVHEHYHEFLKKAIDITKYQEFGYLKAREMGNNI